MLLKSNFGATLLGLAKYIYRCLPILIYCLKNRFQMRFKIIKICVRWSINGPYDNFVIVVDAGLYKNTLKDIIFLEIQVISNRIAKR